VYEEYHPNDHRLHSLYTQQPRELMYYDVDRSQAKSDVVGSPYAAIFDTFTEGHIGLHADLNFWYTKPWTAPAFNPSSPFEGASLAVAQGLRDRQAITAGGWSVLYFGMEPALRRFARAFRSLPPVDMADVGGGPDSVKVRWVAYGGKRYVSALNRTPFAAEVKIDGKAVALAPYDLAALAGAETAPPKVEGGCSPRYRAWLQTRIADYEKLHADVKARDPQAAPELYLKPAQEARKLLDDDRAYAADIALGMGLPGELQLRRDILDRPALKAPKVSAAPTMKGDLNAWPKEASDLSAETGEFIAGHIFFPNSWTGPEDLSVRLRLAHDGTNLYVGVEVRDSVIDPKDAIAISISKTGYSDWRGTAVKPDATWSASPPADEKPASGKSGALTYTIRRTKTGYLLEGSAPLEAIGVKPGGAIGFLIRVSDEDKTPNLAKQPWAIKQAMLIPHKPNFTYWDDARNCGRLVLE
jgi:hypothetical protein